MKNKSVNFKNKPDSPASPLDATDRRIINALQYGFPVSDYPFQEAAASLKLSETELLERIKNMRENGLLTRFGPLYNAEKMGGALSLCAMIVAEEKFDKVAQQVNSFAQVAHNYERDHKMNMWFVLATQSIEEKQQTLEQIEQLTGYPVYDMPRQKEYFVGLFLNLEPVSQQAHDS